ncbi:MAG: hypothetical protein OFPII_31250 [Osedax symbiont Rs1]|nr:MAG: hypothetical protein OFPII_31250 [Osedax symbiont Rs1]
MDDREGVNTSVFTETIDERTINPIKPFRNLIYHKSFEYNYFSFTAERCKFLSPATAVQINILLP